MRIQSGKPARVSFGLRPIGRIARTLASSGRRKSEGADVGFRVTTEIAFAVALRGGGTFPLFCYLGGKAHAPFFASQCSSQWML